MRSFIDFAKVRPQSPDIIWVRLHPETTVEKKLLSDGADTLAIENHYNAAVTSKLTGYRLVKIVDKSQWPNVAQVQVQKLS